MRDCLLLVFANKQDLPGGQSAIQCLIGMRADVGFSVESGASDGKAWAAADERSVVVCASEVCFSATFKGWVADVHLR